MPGSEQKIALHVHTQGTPQAQIVQLPTSTQDGPARIKATPESRYQFIDSTGTSTPSKITTSRHGNDLHVVLGEASEQADLIIEDFYSHAPDTYSLFGTTQDGSLQAYLPATADASNAVSMLAEGTQATQHLAGDTLSSVWAGSASSATPVLAGIGALALAGIAIGGGSSNSKSSNKAPIGVPPI
ncbi:hypothetical protein WGP40_04060 [Brachymonas sp. G13]|uniref:hypothetical protein n=1 Tax=Brachymonas wangyanguii TaxID=3130163 RepID=UPI00307D9248